LAEPAKPADDKHRANLLALLFLLRQLALQLVEEGQVAEARGFVDLVESLQAKTRGNVDSEEEKAIEEVLFQVRMAVIQGRRASGTRETPSAKEETSPERSEKPAKAEEAGKE
jgi:hypothetical protein